MGSENGGRLELGGKGGYGDGVPSHQERADGFDVIREEAAASGACRDTCGGGG